MKNIFILSVFLSLCCFSFASDLEKNTGDEPVLKIYKIQYSDPVSLGEVFEHMKSARGKISVHAGSNSIIINDIPRVHESVEKVLDEIDKAPRQVDLKVLVLETSGDVMKRAGLIGSKTVLSPDDFNKMTYLFREDVSTNIRSEMSLRTLSGHAVKLQVAEREIFPGAVYHDEGMTIIEESRERSAGDFLEAVPVVKNDGSILVKLQPSRKDFSGEYGTDEKTIITQVLVNDGDTIALGGLDTVSNTSMTRDIPLTGLSAVRVGKSPGKVVMFLTVNID